MGAVPLHTVSQRVLHGCFSRPSPRSWNLVVILASGFPPSRGTHAALSHGLLTCWDSGISHRLPTGSARRKPSPLCGADRTLRARVVHQHRGLTHEERVVVINPEVVDPSGAPLIKARPHHDVPVARTQVPPRHEFPCRHPGADFFHPKWVRVCHLEAFELLAGLRRYKEKLPHQRMDFSDQRFARASLTPALRNLKCQQSVPHVRALGRATVLAVTKYLVPGKMQRGVVILDEPSTAPTDRCVSQRESKIAPSTLPI